MQKVFAKKNGFKSTFSPILLCERYMGINSLDHDNLLQLSFFPTFSYAGTEMSV